MLALALLEENTCDGCGGLLGETTRSDAEDGYEVGKAVRCHRCTALAEAAHRYRNNEHPHVLRYPVVREPPPRPPPPVDIPEDPDLSVPPAALAALIGL